MDKSLPVQLDSYDDAVRWIYGRINYEHVRPLRQSTHFRLDRIRHLLSLIDAPQDRIPAVHIAGTKGKGSTAAMLDSILRVSGIRTGLFTSPHIESFAERMKVNGRQPDPGQLTELVAELKHRLQEADTGLVRDGPTYFEVATLLAWMYFDRCEAELVILETGVGGRLDCTNVCQPLVTVITSIGLDHTHLLGDTIEQIAVEKAGILKQGVPLVTGVVQPCVIEICDSPAQSVGCPVTRLHRNLHVVRRTLNDSGSTISVTTPQRQHTNLEIPLHGDHQTENAALAVATADLLAVGQPVITPEAIRGGLARTVWPLRFEVVSRQPTIILDAAHNPDAVAAVVRTLDNGRWSERPRVLMFGASCDKDAEGMLRCLLPAFDVVILTRFERNPRSRSPDVLHETACGLAEGQRLVTADNPAEALGTAESLAGCDGLICGTGSLFLAAELRIQLQQVSRRSGTPAVRQTT